MSDFKAKMHQNPISAGAPPNETPTARDRTRDGQGRCSAPDPAGGAYSAPPDPLDGFKGAYF